MSAPIRQHMYTMIIQSIQHLQPTLTFRPTVVFRVHNASWKRLHPFVRIFILHTHRTLYKYSLHCHLSIFQSIMKEALISDSFGRTVHKIATKKLTKAVPVLISRKELVVFHSQQVQTMFRSTNRCTTKDNVDKIVENLCELSPVEMTYINC